MKVTYLNHSGFLLETAETYFLFDYYKGEIPQMNPEKDIIVFVSHKHADHYNPEIFELAKHYGNIQFVVSKDVPVKWQILRYEEQGISLSERVTVVRKSMEYNLSLVNGKVLQIETLKSTDEGVAFLLTYEGKRYYHAGDLNLWIWEGESKQYNDNMTKAYFRELSKLKNKELEVAFVPLDPRQEKDAFAGMEAFLENVECKKVFPMHFWDDYEIIEKFLLKHPEQEGKVCRIGETGSASGLS